MVRTLRTQPDVIGAEANRVLAAHGRKIGPDPASLHDRVGTGQFGAGIDAYDLIRAQVPLIKYY